MGQLTMHRLDRENQPVRLADAVADYLKALSLTAKEIALKSNLDPRTVANALAGHCSLDTYGALLDAYGFDFADAVAERRIGTDKLTAWEASIERDRAKIATAEAALERLRAAGRARASMAGGGLRLVPEEDRSWPSLHRGGPRDDGSSGTSGPLTPPKRRP